MQVQVSVLTLAWFWSFLAACCLALVYSEKAWAWVKPEIRPGSERRRERGQIVDLSGLPCEGRFRERKLGPPKLYHL